MLWMLRMSAPEYRHRVAAIIGETGRVTSRVARQYDAEVFVRLDESYNAPTITTHVDRWGRYRVELRRWTGEAFETTELAAGELS